MNFENTSRSVQLVLPTHALARDRRLSTDHVLSNRTIPFNPCKSWMAVTSFDCRYGVTGTLSRNDGQPKVLGWRYGVQLGRIRRASPRQETLCGHPRRTTSETCTCMAGRLWAWGGPHGLHESHLARGRRESRRRGRQLRLMARACVRRDCLAEYSALSGRGIRSRITERGEMRRTAEHSQRLKLARPTARRALESAAARKAN